MLLTLKVAICVAVCCGALGALGDEERTDLEKVLEFLQAENRQNGFEHLEKPLKSERNLNGIQKVADHQERRNIDTIEQNVDAYGMTVMIDGQEYRPNIPDRPNPMNFEKVNIHKIDEKRSHHIVKRNFGLDFEQKRWPGNTVPYVIKEDTFGENLATAKSLIQAAIKEIQESSCVQWVPRTDQKYYVKFEGYHSEGCSTTVGFVGYTNGHSINIAKGCLEIETVLHEMNHVMGANHEVQRLDRSNYVTVLWNQIHYSKYPQYTVKKATRDRFPYDYHSVMHYRLSTFPLFPNQNTIQLRDPELNYLVTVPKKSLSFLDVAELNDAYQCTESCTIQCQNGGFPIKTVSGGCKCKCPSGLEGDHCELAETSSTKIKQFLRWEDREYVDCGGIITLKTNEELYLFLEDTNYEQGKNCTWLFKGAPGTRIRALPYHMNLPRDENNVCQHWLEFRGYHIGTPGKKLCGKSEDNKIYAKGYVAGEPTMMMIRFVPKTTVSSTRDKHFRLSVGALTSGCASNPCQHGGSCYDPADGTHSCNCVNGFSGDNCEKFLDTGYNSCDFSTELKTCVFQQDLLNSDFYWVFTTLICRDFRCNIAIYTEQSRGEQFLTINTVYNNYKLYGKKSYLTSSVSFSEKNRCLSFEYNMGNNTSGSHQTIVRVHSEGKGKSGVEKEMLWELKEATHYKWHTAYISIYSKKNLKIIIEAVMGPQELGIDNMVLQPGSCTETVCNPSPCQNGGTCKSFGTTYSCSCAQGFTGINCDKLSACEPNPCQYGGVCSRVGTTTTWECTCKPGYSGQHCEVQNDPCGSKPCKNGGTCLPAKKGDPFPYKCTCPSETFGDNCEGFSCTFETEKWCGSLAYGQQPEKHWKRIKGPTPSPSTGPMKAAEGQYYLYMETSDIDAEESALFFVSHQGYFEKGTYCLSFQYSLIGENVGTFKVVLFESVNWTYRFQLDCSGPQLGGEWLTFRETVTIDPLSYILIQGTKGSGFKSDFAVDNIRLMPGVCPY